MSTVIADTYTFSNLVDWELFYLGHKNDIDAKDTRWLNKHITITDNGKFYKIMKRKSSPTGVRKLYLKPIIKLDPKETTADLTLHTLNLIITKLQDIDDRIISAGSGTAISSHNTDMGRSSIPNKGIIERVKEIKPDQTGPTV